MLSLVQCSLQPYEGSALSLILQMAEVRSSAQGHSLAKFEIDPTYLDSRASAINLVLDCDLFRFACCI